MIERADSLERRLGLASALVEAVLCGTGQERGSAREAERRRHAAIELVERSTLPAAMFDGTDRTATFTNTAWRALFGDNRTLDPRLAPQVEAVLRSGEAVHVPSLSLDHEGQLRDVAATVCAARDPLGATTGVVVVCDLITDETVARTLGVDAGLPIWGGPLGGGANYSNPAWRLHTGGTLARWQDTIHADDLDRCLRALAEASRTRGVVEIEARLVSHGEPRWHRLAISIARGRWFVAAVDIHATRSTSVERAELLADALAARADAELANRRKDQFLAAVSHELRAPLTTMMLWEKVLRDETADAALRAQALDAIHDSAVVQARLVGDLLDIARAISGKLHVDLRAIDAAQIVGEAIAAIADAAVARGITIVQPAAAGRVLATGDAFRVRQIVDNLLSNALKFTERGGTIRIEIQTRHHTVTISIADTGRGISEGFLDQIFEPFSQSDDELTGSGTGLGLGLAISKQLAELQHGTLTVVSPGPGQGSTFSVSLPAAGRASSPIVAPHAPELPDHRILIVDDDRRVLDALALLLERTGAKVATAESAELARTLIAERPFDVVLCDIAMPGEDGYSFITRLRSSGFRAPSIALTAHALEADARRALAAGFDVHLAKPIDFEKLVATIAEMVARPSTTV